MKNSRIKEKRQHKTSKTKTSQKNGGNFYVYFKKITNNDAKNIIRGQDVILVDDSSIDAYTDSTNYYNAGVYGWNYSIGYSTRLDKYIICGYRIPQSVLNATKSVTKMVQKEAYLHA